jgi:hypothetical protein
MNNKLDIVPQQEYFKGYRIAKFKYKILNEEQNLTIIKHYLQAYPLAN